MIKLDSIFDEVRKENKEINSKDLLSILGTIVKNVNDDDENVKLITENCKDLEEDEKITFLTIFICNIILLNIYNIYYKKLTPEQDA